MIRLLDKFLGDTKISPYSLIELDLLLKSKEIIVKEVKTFYETLSDLFEYREIGSLSTKPQYHGEAHDLRNKYERLTYFDSLHAAVAMIENLELVSYDKEYGKVRELKYKHPEKYAR